MAISNLYYEIGGDTTRLNKALDESVERAKQAGIKISAAGKSMLKSFDDAINPTKRLGDQIKVLQAAGRSGEDIWRVYGNRLQEAAAKARSFGKAVDPAVQDLIRLNATAKKSQSIFGGLVSSFKSVQGALLGLGVGVGIAQVTRSLVEFGKEATKAAMSAVESENLFAVSMGNMTDSAVKWSQDLSKSLGLNQYELRKNIGTFNVMFKAMDLGADTSYKMSAALTELAYDFASFYDLDPGEAFTKLRAGITGETEPLKRLGILVDEATTKAYAYKSGLVAVGEQLTQQQKVLARYGALMEQTTAAQGDMARTIESPANALRVLQSRLDEIQITLGMAFLPAVASTIEIMTNFLQSVSDTSEGMSGLADIIAYPIKRFNQMSMQAAIVNRVFQGMRKSFLEFAGASEESIKKVDDSIKAADETIAKIAKRAIKLDEAIKSVGKFDYDAAKAAAAIESLKKSIDGIGDSTIVLKEKVSDYLSLFEIPEELIQNFRSANILILDADRGATQLAKDLNDKLTKAYGEFNEELSFSDDQLNDFYKSLLEADKSHTLWAEDQIRHMKEVTGEYGKFGKEIDTVFDDLTRDLADNILEWESWSDVVLGIIRDFAKMGLRYITQGLFSPLKNAMQNFGQGLSGGSPAAGDWGNLLGGVGKLGAGMVLPASISAAMSNNPYVSGAGRAGLAFGGMGALSYMGAAGIPGMTGIGSLATSLLGGPFAPLIAGGAAGIPALINWASGPNSYEAGVKEISRDFGGVSMGEGAYQEYLGSLGVSESRAWDYRAQLNRTPVMIQALAQLAEQQGKLESFLKSLEASTAPTGSGGWGSNIRPAVETGMVTGDWSSLDEWFIGLQEQGFGLEKIVPQWKDLALIMDESKEAAGGLVDSFIGLRDAIKSGIKPVDDMFDKFLQTGTITEGLSAKILEFGGDLEAFQNMSSLASLNRYFEEMVGHFRATGEILPDLSRLMKEYGGSLSVIDQAAALPGLKQSLGLITNLSGGLSNLMTQFDPINMLLSGNMNASVEAALAGAGLDPSRFTNLTGMIGAQNNWNTLSQAALSGGRVSGDLLDILSQYGGSAGQLAADRYGQGFNTITPGLLEATKAAMDTAYQGELQAAIDYLAEVGEETTSEIEALTQTVEAELELVGDNITTALNDAKNAVVDAINDLAVAIYRGEPIQSTAGGTSTGSGSTGNQPVYIVNNTDYSQLPEWVRSILNEMIDRSGNPQPLPYFF